MKKTWILAAVCALSLLMMTLALQPRPAEGKADLYFTNGTGAVE